MLWDYGNILYKKELRLPNADQTLLMALPLDSEIPSFNTPLICRLSQVIEIRQDPPFPNHGKGRAWMSSIETDLEESAR